MSVPTPEQVYQEMLAIGTDPLQKRNTLGFDFTTIDRHDTYDFITPSQFDMTGRTVLVTGASKGIGKAHAVSYAKAGVSNICISARTSLDGAEQEILEAARTAGRPAPQVLKLKMDITSRQECERGAAEVKKSFGGLDILVNNAGYMESDKPILEVDIDDWWQCWHVNVYGTFLVSRFFIPLLLNHTHHSPLKTCINISSIFGLHKDSENTAYLGSKFAQLRLTELLTASFPTPNPTKTPDGSDDGLLCISFHPGGLRTELGLRTAPKMHPFLSDTAELTGDTIVWLTAERKEWLRDRYVSAQWDMEEVSKMEGEIVRDDLLKVRLSVGGGAKTKTNTWSGVPKS